MAYACEVYVEYENPQKTMFTKVYYDCLSNRFFVLFTSPTKYIHLSVPTMEEAIAQLERLAAQNRLRSELT